MQGGAVDFLTNDTWPIDRLVHYARNPRKNDAVVDRMCASLREFGFKIPVLARNPEPHAIFDWDLEWPLTWGRPAGISVRDFDSSSLARHLGFSARRFRRTHQFEAVGAIDQGWVFGATGALPCGSSGQLAIDAT